MTRYQLAVLLLRREWPTNVPPVCPGGEYTSTWWDARWVDQKIPGGSMAVALIPLGDEEPRWLGYTGEGAHALSRGPDGAWRRTSARHEADRLAALLAAWAPGRALPNVQTLPPWVDAGRTERRSMSESIALALIEGRYTTGPMGIAPEDPNDRGGWWTVCLGYDALAETNWLVLQTELQGSSVQFAQKHGDFTIRVKALEGERPTAGFSKVVEALHYLESHYPCLDDSLYERVVVRRMADSLTPYTKGDEAVAVRLANALREKGFGDGEDEPTLEAIAQAKAELGLECDSCQERASVPDRDDGRAYCARCWADR